MAGRLDIFKITPKITAINWTGLLQSYDTGAISNVITAVAKPGTTTYTTTKTIPAPADSRLVAVRRAVRVNIADFTITGAPGNLNYDLTERPSGGSEVSIKSGAWSAASPLLVAVDRTVNVTDAITYRIYLWSDTYNAGVDEITITLVQLWAVVGTCDAASGNLYIAQLNFAGKVAILAQITRQGTGTPQLRIVDTDAYGRYVAQASGVLSYLEAPIILLNNCRLQMSGSVATDINYCKDWTFLLEEWL